MFLIVQSKDWVGYFHPRQRTFAPPAKKNCGFDWRVLLLMPCGVCVLSEGHGRSRWPRQTQSWAGCWSRSKRRRGTDGTDGVGPAVWRRVTDVATSRSRLARQI